MFLETQQNFIQI